MFRLRFRGFGRSLFRSSATLGCDTCRGCCRYRSCFALKVGAGDGEPMFGEGVRRVRRRRCAGQAGSGYEHEYSELNHNPIPSVSNQ